MLIVHHLNNSRSQRILWMLEELGVEYEIASYERDAVTMLAPAALKAVHPLGKSPVIEDAGVVVAESGAIVEYLAEQYDGLRPAGTMERRRATYWVHFAEGSMAVPLLLKLYLGRVGAAAAPLAERVEGQIATLLGYVETELADAPFLAGGELSVADIMMSYPLEAAVARTDASGYPGVLAYLERIQARPAYRAALVRGGPYAILR
jgi:glutathione S-transferase